MAHPGRPSISPIQPQQGVDNPTEAIRIALRATPHAPNVIAALEDVLDGKPIYQAATDNTADRSHITMLALRHGLVVKTGRLVSGHKRVAALAAEELERRLIENPDALSVSELNFAGGTSTDKVAKYERWGAEPIRDNAYASGLAAALTALAETGGSITLELRVEPGRMHADDDAIDIEPTAGTPT